MSQFIFYLFFLIVANVLLNNFFLYKDYIYSDLSSLNNKVINKNLRNNCCIDNIIDNTIDDNNIDKNFDNNNINNIIKYYLRQVE